MEVLVGHGEHSGFYSERWEPWRVGGQTRSGLGFNGVIPVPLTTDGGGQRRRRAALWLQAKMETQHPLNLFPLWQHGGNPLPHPHPKTDEEKHAPLGRLMLLPTSSILSTSVSMFLKQRQ